jgi:hypothetical protein
MTILELQSEIEAKVEAGGVLSWIRGRLIGRTLEEHPRYDVSLADGRMVPNLQAEYVRPVAVSP